MKLTTKQREALEWLAQQPWKAPWWSGRPHVSWPKQMDGRTYRALHKRGFVEARPGTWSEKIIAITAPGRVALEACHPQRDESPRF